jgi:hypothetical protein
MKDKKPSVLFDQSDVVSPEDMMILLRNFTDDDLKWEPKIAKLSFPFENNEILYKRVLNGKYSDLINTFKKSYSVLNADNLTIFDWEKKKMETLNKLDSLIKK